MRIFDFFGLTRLEKPGNDVNYYLNHEKHETHENRYFGFFRVFRVFRGSCGFVVLVVLWWWWSFAICSDRDGVG
jgi:hypothetical protein